MRSKILITIVVVVLVIVGIGVGVGLLAGGGTGKPHPATTMSEPTTEPSHSTVAETHPTPLTQNPSSQVKTSTVEPTILVQTSNITASATNLLAGETNWEDKIDDIVGSEDSDTNKVKQLFALFPKLPPDGQEEAVQHLSNLVEDDNYAQLGDMLKNAKLSEGVLDELLADALNRPNNLKLPLLLDVASNPDHAKKDEAKDLLELYLGEDYGTDWAKWKDQMTTWLKDNPD